MSNTEKQIALASLLVATLLVTVAFLSVILPFLVTLLLAGIIAALYAPLRDKVLTRVGGRRPLAALITLLILTATVLLPLMGIIVLAAAQAQGLFAASQDLGLEEMVDVEATLEWLPFMETIEEQWDAIEEKVTALASDLASAFAGFATDLVVGSAQFFLSLFIFMYGLFSFLMMPEPVLLRLLGYSGLSPDTQNTVYERIVTISGATLKGTLVIGLVQGGLGGIGLLAVGAENIAFWTVIMFVLSVIPAIGPLLILIPFTIELFLEGQVGAAVGLAVWGVAVVGTIDNILRPMLVGRDAALHDLMILISTLGGLVAFGAVGLVLGPVLAGVFVALWETLNTSTDAQSQTPALQETEETPGPT